MYEDEVGHNLRCGELEWALSVSPNKIIWRLYLNHFCGIITMTESAAAVAAVRTMMTAMAEIHGHGQKEQVTVLEERQLGVYAAVTSTDADQGRPSTFKQSGDRIKSLGHGECRVNSVEESGISIRTQGGRLAPAADVAAEIYQLHGVEGIPGLNGLFSCLVVDKNTGHSYLINDRYGLQRLYIHQSANAFYFASEAKAILAAVPSSRQWDEESVAQYLSYGCTYGTRTLFKGISLLPGGSCVTFANGDARRTAYFSPEEWEGQEPLESKEFAEELGGLLARLVPQYSSNTQRLAISLTAGLDTRMIMAHLVADPAHHTCFTYSGQHIDPLDATLSAEIARGCGLEHHVLRIENDFFRDFPALAERTVWRTDGCSGMTGAHEVYMSRKARALAPLRLTGNYGSEILRGVSTFKPLRLHKDIMLPEMRESVDRLEADPGMVKCHPVTFAAFRETPWNLFGNLQAGCSEIGFRTPYLDNEFVKLAYRGPRDRLTARKVCEAVVRRGNPKLAAILTDKGYLGPQRARWKHQRDETLARMAFKLDYLYSSGLPSMLAMVEPALVGLAKTCGWLGLHKHITYRTWFQSELVSALRGMAEQNAKHLPDIIEKKSVGGLISRHVRKEGNYMAELNAVLSLGLVGRTLLSSR
jgi:asparagine synthase (glutamine-hydrolysing)